MSRRPSPLALVGSLSANWIGGSLSPLSEQKKKKKKKSLRLAVQQSKHWEQGRANEGGGDADQVWWEGRPRGRNTAGKQAKDTAKPRKHEERM